jgi:hypothetical protein
MVSGVGTSAPPGEGGLIGAVDRFVSRIENAFNAIAAVCIVIMQRYLAEKQMI